jgi:chromosome transmission fidelity protein 4
MAGRNRFMAVVYHDSTPLVDGTQQLGYQLWDVTSLEVLSEGSLSCLNKSASLTWLGFSNDMSLMAMDSDGMLSMLVQTGLHKWEWAPILDTMGLRKSMDDQFWPITVYDGKMVCVPLKGGNSYPDAARKPVTSTLALRLPLAASTSGKM